MLWPELNDGITKTIDALKVNLGNCAQVVQYFHPRWDPCELLWNPHTAQPVREPCGRGCSPDCGQTLRQVPGERHREGYHEFRYWHQSPE